MPPYRAVADQAQANRNEHPPDALPWALGQPTGAGAGAVVHRGRSVVGERL
jgi:hypothetical protein